jgi:hypothetical protein
MKQHLRPTPNVPPIETQHECIHDFFTRLRRYVVRTHFFFCQSRHLQYGSSKIRALLESFASLGADAERELELLGGDLVDPLAFPRRDDAALVELELLDGCRRPVQLHGVGGRVDEVVRGRRGRRGGLEADPPGGVDRGADVGLVALRDGVRVLAPARAGGAGGGGDREEGVPEGVSGDDGGGGVPVGPADLGGRPRRRRRRRRRGRGERRRDGRAAGHAERRQVRQAPEEREQGGGGGRGRGGVGVVVAAAAAVVEARRAREARRRRAGVVGRHRAREARGRRAQQLRRRARAQHPRRWPATLPPRPKDPHVSSFVRTPDRTCTSHSHRAWAWARTNAQQDPGTGESSDRGPGTGKCIKSVEIKLAHLPVGGAVVLDDPPRLAAERLEHLVVVAVLGQLVVAEGAEAREDLGGDGPPPALPALVVLPLLPRRRPPQTSRRRRPGRHGLMLSQPLLPEAPTCLPFSLMERWWVAYCTVLTTTTSGGGREATERREVAAWWRCSSSRVGVECCYVMAWRASCFELFHSRARPGSRSRGWYRKLITLLQLNWLDSTGTGHGGCAWPTFTSPP